MLLLDHNPPHQLRDLLAEYGIDAETTKFRGWDQLRNGDLVSAAHAAGIRTIYTRDRLFGESAAKTLTHFQGMSLVVITLPQRSWKLYRDAFKVAWQTAPVVPQPGKVISWP
jgi:hypothetical protein